MGGPCQQWQADLVDLSKLKNDNDGDRRLYESSLECSAQEQVRDVVGDCAEKHLHQRLAKDVADRSRTRNSE